MPDFDRERRAGGHVAGIDEVGRGTLAGPVIAAAVILDPANLPPGIDDSKALTAARRARVHDAIMGSALAVGIGVGEVAEIDRINILNATMAAMLRAVDALRLRPTFALVDGDRVPDGLPCPAEAVVKGDAHALSIAAASIIAKVTRDRLMADLDLACPGYNWARNKGYGTADHMAALQRLGPSLHHRRSFAPISQMKLEFAP